MQTSTHNNPQILRMRDELTWDEDILIKGSRFIIPSALAGSFLYEEYTNITKHQLTARSPIYWSGIDVDMEDFIKQCSTYIKLPPTLPAESLINHEAFQGLWQKISTDFLESDNRRYLLIIDYFTKYPFLFQMFSTTISAVISQLTEMFFYKGTPLKSSITMDKF